MSYWNETRTYKFNSPHEAAAYFAGIEAGVRAFATWDNGLQFVGSLRRPLIEVLVEIREEFCEALKNLGEPVT